MQGFTYEIVQEQSCGSCMHYRRHYVMTRHPGYRYFMPLHYGHCVYPRHKKRAPEQSCPRWEKAAAVPPRGGENRRHMCGK